MYTPVSINLGCQVLWNILQPYIQVRGSEGGRAGMVSQMASVVGTRSGEFQTLVKKLGLTSDADTVSLVDPNTPGRLCLSIGTIYIFSIKNLFFGKYINII